MFAWFLPRGVIDRRRYALIGCSLMALKYLVEAALLWSTTGRVLSPLTFLVPLITVRLQAFAGAPEWVMWALAVWTVPFVWVGLCLSLRRALDAGRPAATGLCFLIPFVNYVFMCYLCVAPTLVQTDSDDKRDQSRAKAQHGIIAACAGFAVALVMVLISVYGLREYGTALFILTPVVVGVITGLIASSGSVGRAANLAMLAIFMAGLALFAYAAEGVICLAMAMVPALPLAALGGVIGWSLGRAGPGSTRSGAALVLLLGLPLIAWSQRDAPPAHRCTTTVIEIAAPPERVWPVVVAFSELPPPDGIFTLGIACPMRAHITGSGVGAIRRCEFTTGAFIEPITVWDEPQHLAFDVAEDPPPMTELTLYVGVEPPHLEGYFRSRRGEFRLSALPGGRTRLEGTTWYDLDVHPLGYWTLWTEPIVHAIHRRVLEHIRRLAESAPQTAN